MASQPMDLLVVGGGITGAGIARDAALRGIRTAVIDKGDFAGGTSGNSSRLINGDLRYMDFRQWRLVRDACRERQILLRIAPHLVWPQAFVFPIHKGARLSLFKLSAGLALYDLLAPFRNLRLHRIIGRKSILRIEPNIRSRDLKGGVLYLDAKCDDARLTIATIRSAHKHGAMVANYLVLNDFERAGGRVCGARVTDRVTNQTYTIHATVVVNATGPWSDSLVRREGDEPMLRPTRGVHVGVPEARIGNREAVAMVSPIDGRIVFVVPWGQLSYIGTTETEDDSSPDDARAHAADVVYLLRTVNAIFPAARLSAADVVSTWTGIRPLIAPGQARQPNDPTTERRVVESEPGMVSVLGGTLTTYRLLAAETVDVVAGQLTDLDGRHLAGRPPTHREPLPGGEVQDLDVLITQVVREGFARETAEYLVKSFGTETAAVVRLAQSDPALAQPIVGGHPAIRAQIIHAIRREMAMTLSDLLIRRLHLFHEVTGHAVPEAPAVVDLAADELGWDAGRKASELAAYLEEIQRGMAFRSELLAEDLEA